VSALSYAAGSLVGGALTERFGRRTVLVAAVLLVGGGLVLQGAVPSWAAFLLLGIPRGLGGGALDGGVSAMVLDLYPDARGRALNFVHLFFALGAFVAPIALGALVDGGVAWQLLLAVTGAVTFMVAIPMLVTDLGDRPAAATAHATTHVGRLWLAPPILALGAGIGLYVAAEMGVSSWLVRFLASSPLTVATTALGLFWGGLMLGRLTSARFADRFDHITLAMAAAVAAAVALAGAILVPVVPVQIALFALVGFAYGPIYPLMVAVAGERYPDRASAVSGILTAAGVGGSVIYPPLMGLLSVSIGLPAAMAGTVLICLGCAVAVAVAGRLRLPDVANEGATAA
jgi:fucose permease